MIKVIKLKKEPKVDEFANYLHKNNKKSFFDSNYTEPNESNLSFRVFIKKLKLEDNTILAHLLYLHFSKSKLIFDEWNTK